MFTYGAGPKREAYRRRPAAVADSARTALRGGSAERRVWAAKFTARHPNLVALEMSSFKCGHDAPIYTVIESIIEKSGTPYFAFKDVDENKPTGSIRIRVETIHYFLKRYVENLKDGQAPAAMEQQLREYEQRVREELLREHEYAELAARQQEESARWRTLPVIPLGQGGTCGTELHP